MSRPRTASCPGMEIFNWRKGSKEWETSWIHHGDQEEPPAKAATDSFDVTVYNPRQLLKYHDYGTGADRDTFSAKDRHEASPCRSCLAYLVSSFKFLAFYWEPLYLDSPGYFGCQDEFDEDGAVVGVSTGARFIIQHFNRYRNIEEAITHKWRDIIVFTHWVKATKQSKILFLRSDAPEIPHIVPKMLRNLQSINPVNDPFWPYVTILDDYLNLQHKATYAIRDLTEAQERKAEVPGQLRPLQTRTDYARLHEIARHALTVTEILKVNIKSLEHIMRYHGGFMEHEQAKTNGSNLDTTVQRTHQRLLLYEHMGHSLYCRCASYADRMKNVIELSFNLVSQDEAHTLVEIAQAAKADSETMKVISLVALIFLPPTFISAIFSTTFFNFGADEDSWEVSKKFYIYWVFVLPITVVSVLLWFTRVLNDSVVDSTLKSVNKWISRVASVDIEK